WRLHRTNATALARLDHFRGCSFGDCAAADVVVNSQQRSRCRKIFRVAVWLGPRPGKSFLVLAEEHRALYSVDPRSLALAVRREAAGSSQALNILFAVYTLLYQPECFEDGAVDLG